MKIRALILNLSRADAYLLFNLFFVNGTDQRLMRTLYSTATDRHALAIHRR